MSVGTSSTAIVAANPNRRGLILQSLHATQTIDIALSEESGTDPTAVTGEGFRLKAAGDNMFKITKGDGSIYTGAVAGIASGATTPCGVIEW